MIPVSFSVALKYKTILSTFYWKYELLLGKVYETSKELIYNYASSETRKQAVFPHSLVDQSRKLRSSYACIVMFMFAVEVTNN